MTEEATNAEIQAISQDNCINGNVVVYTDGSVKRGFCSEWGFLAIIVNFNNTIHEQGGATSLTTSSVCMESKTIAKRLEWIKNLPYTRASHLSHLLPKYARQDSHQKVIC